LAIFLFEKANQMGMMEKGYVWIVTDEIASLLDSVDSSITYNMQGVLGLKTILSLLVKNSSSLKSNSVRNMDRSTHKKRMLIQAFLRFVLIMQHGLLLMPLTCHKVLRECVTDLVTRIETGKEAGFFFLFFLIFAN
jgi:hypothetical protein